MARETQPPSSSGPASGPSSSATPGSLPGLGHVRTSAFELRGDPRRGASEAAPTAPHATAPAARDASGPARFWRSRGVRVALILAAIFSTALHMALTPWKLFPDRSAFSANDVEGELSIPVDLLEDQPPPPEPAAPAEPASTAPGPNARDAAAPKPKPKPDAGPDAEALAALDGGVEAGAADAGELDGAADAGAVALADAGASGAGGPRDPGGLVGLSHVVNAGPQNVVLIVNVATIAKNPLSPRIGGVLQVIPQWREFLRGSSNAAQVDPMQYAQWILIYGPSLINTDRDAVLVRYSAPDAIVDGVVAGLAKRAAADGKRGPKGEVPGPYDAGVPGVPATLGHADNALRVFMRPQPKLLVIVPPSHAHAAALAYKGKAPRGPDAAEAMRLVVRNPSQQIAIKGVRFDQHLKELTIVIRPDAAGGADVDGEGDLDDDAAAQQVADDLTDLLKQQNTGAVRIFTHGLLNGARVTHAGEKKIGIHLHATQDQLSAVLGLVESFTGAGAP